MENRAPKRSGESNLPVTFSQAISPWPNPPVVFRFDAVELYIDCDQDNSELLLRLGYIPITEAIRYALGGFRRSDYPPRFSLRPTEYWGWRFAIGNGVTQVAVFGTTFHLGEIKAMNRRCPPGEIRNRLFPTASEIMEHQYRREYLGKIRITNPAKISAQIHQEYCEKVIRGLESLGIKFTPKKIEVCLDTTDPKKGRLLLAAWLPSYFNPDMLYHFNENGEKIKGPSPVGENEDVGLRPKGRWDVRPNEERPRGGRRVHHPYVKIIQLKSIQLTGKIYRLEVQLYTTSVKEMMRGLGINEVLTMIKELPSLTKRLFRFRKMDLKALYRAHPWTRDLSLKPMSVRGQFYTLAKHGLDRKEIARFLRKIRCPRLLVYREDSAEYPENLNDSRFWLDYWYYPDTNRWVLCSIKDSRPADPLWLTRP